MAPFKYRGGDRKVEDVVKRSKQSGGSYDSWLSADATFLKIREGDNAVRILPPTWKDIAKYGDGWELQVYLHRSVGPDNGTYLCLDKMLGKPCPCCDARRDAADEDEADKLKPGWRAIAWAIDRDAEKAGPQIMSLPVTLFRDINARSVDKKTNAVILIDDPEEGYDVLFTRTGADLRTKYTAVEVERDSTPVHSDQKKQDRWLAFIDEHPLPDMLVFHPADHIEKVLFGKTERRGKPEDEEEVERPSRRARRGEVEEEPEPVSGRKRRAEPEEEAEVEERPRRRGHEEPEEEIPRRRRRVEDSGDPVDEEVEERPRRRGRAEPEEEAEPEPRSTRRRGREEPEEEPEAETGGKVARRGSRAAEPEEDADSPTTQARGKLERLRNRK